MIKMCRTGLGKNVHAKKRTKSSVGCFFNCCWDSVDVTHKNDKVVSYRFGQNCTLESVLSNMLGNNVRYQAF
jgi:hypothetical protein